MDLKKQGAKNRVIDIQKEKRQQLFLFLNNNDPGFFCTLIFFTVTNRPRFPKQEYWVQNDCASVSLPTPPNSEIICGQNVGTKVVCEIIFFF